jgi:hypothetical protein
MNREEALRVLAERKQELLSRIPADAPATAKRYHHYAIEQEVDAAELHLRALYEAGLEVGADLGALPQYAKDPKYAFWVEGIRRHLQRCAEALGAQGAAAG